MIAEPAECRAVRALVTRSDEPLRFDGVSVVEGPVGVWRVIPWPLGFDEAPDVFIVGPLGGNDPEALVRVADIPGRGLTVLRGPEPLEALLTACPQLAPKTIAALVAVSLGPPGGERVLVGPEVDDALDERAADVPPALRTLDFKSSTGGGWTLAFLTSRLHKQPPDTHWRNTVARWHVALGANGIITWRREALLEDVRLARYA